MEDTSRVRLENLKRTIIVSMAAILALLEGFYFFVMKVPLVECVLEWLFGMSVCLVILHISFRYIFRAEEALQYRVEFEKLITTISTDFINLALDEIDSGINHALQAIGEFAGVDRSYIFLFSENGTKMDNTHEWCAEGIEPQIDNLKGLPVEIFPWWMEKLHRFENIHIPRVADLPFEASAEKESLQSQDIQSLIVVPMVYGGSLIGFLGFDSVQAEKTWAEDIISLLRIVGEIFVNTLVRKRAEEEVERRNQELAALNAIATAVSQSLDLKEVLDAALEETLAVLNVEGGIIYLFDETSQTFAPVVHHGISQDVIREVTGFKMGEGLSGWVAESGEALVVADLGADPRNISPVSSREGWHSYAGVPIKSRGKVLGVMTLATRQEGYFRPDHVGLLSHVGNQLGVAIENARLYEKATERMIEATLLHKVSDTLMRTLNLEQLLENILEVLQKAFGYSHCAILLPDEETEELYVKAVRGYPQATGEGLRIKIGQERITGWVAANKVALNVPDVTKDDRYVEGMEGAKSEIAVPMLVGKQLVGVLDVQSTEVNAFGEDDLRVLSSVAAQAAMAVERVRLFQEARRRSREQATLFRASAAVLATLDVGEVLHEVAKQMTLAMDATSARVCQWNEAERTVTVIAEYITPHASQKEQVSDLGTVYPVKDPKISQALRDRQPWTISLANSEISEEVRSRLEEFGGNTVLYLPLVVRERVIGCVEVWESRRERHFTPQEINLCQVIGNQAAIAIESARLFAAGESSRQKMEAIIQNMTDGLLIVDARCDIMLANQRAAELHAAAVDDMAGQNLLAVCPYASLNALVREALGQSPQITSGEISIEETGHYDLAITVAPFIQEGEQVLWYVLLHDITRLKELDRMKSDFVSNVSHDLRTPLANIKLYAALVQKGRPEKRQHYLATIESETERLEALIEDILDLSRLERGAVKLQMERLPLAEIVQRVVGAHLAAAQAQGVEIAWQVPDGLPTLHADRNQLLLMLNNLLGNALQYTPRGGSVRVEAWAGEWRGGSALLIAVCDTGIGIPADEQEHIFERFYRGRHTPAGTTGTGLGLAIVKESMALHGGEVRVESAVGQGSTFTLCFPLGTEVSHA